MNCEIKCVGGRYELYVNGIFRGSYANFCEAVNDYEKMRDKKEGVA